MGGQYLEPQYYSCAHWARDNIESYIVQKVALNIERDPSAAV